MYYKVRAESLVERISVFVSVGAVWVYHVFKTREPSKSTWSDTHTHTNTLTVATLCSVLYSFALFKLCVLVFGLC